MKSSSSSNVVVLALCAAVLCSALVGCGKKGDNTNTNARGGKADADGLTLAVVPKSTGGDFWETVEKGARNAAGELSCEIKWEGTVTETDIAEQNKILENIINLGVDGIALAPLNPQAQRKLVSRTVQAGIPVVIFDSNVMGDAHSSFVATDNQEGGRIGGRQLAKLLGGKGRVMLMRYVQGTGSTEARAEGFLEIAKQENLPVAADVYPETGTVEGCKNGAANTLQGFVEDGKLELDGIFACNLYSTLGVASALEDLRKGGITVDLNFVGFDTSTKLVRLLQAGEIDALVAQNPQKMGRLAVETLHKVVNGETVPAMVDTGVALVTAEALETDPAMRKLVGLE